jgi:hypothetical protein
MWKSAYGKEANNFHLSISVMTATLYCVACFLHLPVTNRMLDHILIKRGEAVEQWVKYIVSDPEEAILDQ